MVVTNNQIDDTLIHQLSDADSVSVEVINRNSKLIAASVYYDTECQIDDFSQENPMLHHYKYTGILIAWDCNARSTIWHDKITNTRSRILEEFITSKRLFILNEDDRNTTFRKTGHQ